MTDNTKFTVPTPGQGLSKPHTIPNTMDKDLGGIQPHTQLASVT